MIKENIIFMACTGLYIYIYIYIYKVYDKTEYYSYACAGFNTTSVSQYILFKLLKDVHRTTNIPLFSEF